MVSMTNHTKIYHRPLNRKCNILFYFLVFTFYKYHNNNRFDIKFYIDVHKDHTASTDKELTLDYFNFEELLASLQLPTMSTNECY